MITGWSSQLGRRLNYCSIGAPNKRLHILGHFQGHSVRKISTTKFYIRDIHSLWFISFSLEFASFILAFTTPTNFWRMNFCRFRFDSKLLRKFPNWWSNPGDSHFDLRCWPKNQVSIIRTPVDVIFDIFYNAWVINLGPQSGGRSHWKI